LAFLTTASLQSDEPAAQRIGLVPLDKGAQPNVKFLTPHKQFASGLKFVADGKSLMYLIRVSGVDNVWVQPLDGSAGRQITNFPSEHSGPFRLSPDGKSFGMIREHTESDVVLLRDTAAAQ
jgi:eukaryotic-like serine/threonine-protein kinase